MATGEGLEEQDGPGCEASSAEGLVDAVADVTGVEGEVVVPSQAEVDGSRFEAGDCVDHAEEIGGHLVDRVRGEVG